MSKKGAFIYQQIELTTAEWADNATIYPPSVWLFERLESGKFNMKLADGVHTFAQLPAVMQDIAVSVKTNTDTEYVLEIATAVGTITTPNLRGQDGATYDDTAIRSDLTTLEDRFNTLVPEIVKINRAAIGGELKNEMGYGYQDAGWIKTGPVFQFGTSEYFKQIQGEGSSDRIFYRSVVGESITAWKEFAFTNDLSDYLKSIEAASTYEKKVVGKGLSTNDYSDEEKEKVADSLRFKNVTEATTLTGLSIANYSIKVTLSAASALSFANTPPEGWECMIDIKNSSSSDITQPIPNATGWQSEEASVTLLAGKVTSISVRYVHGIYVVRV